MANNSTVSLSENTIERKEFMKKVGMSVGGILLLNCIQACAPSDELPDPNPGTGTGDKVDFTLDLSLSSNAKLNTKGGFLVTKGAIIARTLDDDFIAVSSTCTHEGTTIDKYDATNHKFICPNHNSQFDDTGKVLQGPATAA